MDIGGTKTTGALFTDDGRAVDKYYHVVQSKTFKGEETVYQNTKSVLDHIIEHFNVDLNDVLGIGVGSPGPLNTETGVIIHAPLMGWRNFPIVDRLKMDYNVPVALDNDGNLGALAEWRCGQAKGCSNALYMTVSTGCGGGIIINNKLYHGSRDSAGEFGHMCIVPDGLDCKCGSRGCFELYASGTAMNNIMKADLKKGIRNKTFELAEYKEENINGKILFEAARLGDGYALSIFKNEGYYLGVGIANLLNLFDPEVIVLGGGVTKAREFYHDEMMRVIKQRSLGDFDNDMIKYSVMNDYVVMQGAYYLIKDKIDNL